MGKIILPVLALLLFSSNDCHAYAGSKCHETLFRIHDKATLGTRLSTGASSSTTSFLSSTGNCALIGLSEQRQQFLVANREGVLRESTQGSGEYVDTLAQLSGCASTQAIKSFGAMVQQRFESIYFTGARAASEEEIASRINAEISARPELAANCGING